MKSRKLKIFFYFFAVIVLMVVLGVLTILHTQFGARSVVNYVLSNHLQMIEVKSIKGTLANNLELRKIDINDSYVSIKINQLNYNLKEINWFDFGLEFESIKLDNAEITLIESNQTEANNQEINTIELPIDLIVNSLEVKTLTFINAQSVETFNQINMMFDAKKITDEISIKQFSVKHELMELKTAGQIKLNPLIKFDLSPQWTFQSDDIMLSGIGSVMGGLKKVILEQKLQLTTDIVKSNLTLQTEIDLTQENLSFITDLATENTIVLVNDTDEIMLKKAQVNLSGHIDDYTAKVNILTENGLLPETDINILAQGSLDSINMRGFNIKNTMGQIQGPTSVNWKNNIVINSELTLSGLKPQFYLPEWEGLIDGSSQVTVKISENTQFNIAVSQTELSGILKEQKFKFSGDAKISPNNIEIIDGELFMGNNSVSINALFNNEKLDAHLVTKLNDLNLIDQQLSGMLESEFTINGSVENPQIQGSASAVDLKYNDFRIKQFELKGDGYLGSDFNITIDSSELKINNNDIESMKILLDGSLSHHNLTFNVHNKDYTSTLTAEGHWDQKSQYWKGVVSDHQFKRLDIDSNWYLEKKMHIEINNEISLTNSCWSNMNSTGSICVELNSDKQFENLQANLKLNQLELKSFKAFMPDDIRVTGNLMGDAVIQMSLNDILVDSNIELLNGKIVYAEFTDAEYITLLDKALIQASHKNQKSNLSSEIKFSDGSDLLFTIGLSKDLQNELFVDGNINGSIKNTNYLTSLTNEIREFEGEIDLGGTIVGPISRPEINLLANQKNGYVLLNQTGSRIENLTLKLSNNNNLNSTYNIKYLLSGTNGEGNISSDGFFSYNENDDWNIKGNVVGDKFRLLTLPEIELDISPQLNFVADKEKLSLDGEIKIPYSNVNVESLPESAVSVSNDVIMHTAELEKTDEYKILFDVNAILENPMGLNALGLTSEVTGQLRVNNIKNPDIDGFGSLKLIDGVYKIYGQSLDITNGDLFFNGAISNPNIQVRASRKSLSPEVVAGVDINGSVNRLESTLFSEPTLSEIEILSYILTGKGLNSTSDVNSEQLAQAAILLGLQKSSPIFSQIQSTFGIDVLNFKEGATTKESIVEAGKNLNEKVYIGYNHGLFNRVGFWVLRYQLNKALKLETTQGENQSVDLIYSRQKK